MPQFSDGIPAARKRLIVETLRPISSASSRVSTQRSFTSTTPIPCSPDALNRPLPRRKRRDDAEHVAHERERPSRRRAAGAARSRVARPLPVELNVEHRTRVVFEPDDGRDAHAVAFALAVAANDLERVADLER